MPISLTPLQGQTLAENIVTSARTAIDDARQELNHLGLGLAATDPSRAHDYFVAKGAAPVREGVRVAVEDAFLATTILKGVLGSLPLAVRVPGREALAGLQVVTRKLGHMLQTSELEKSFAHGVAAYDAIRGADDAGARLTAAIAALRGA